MACVWDATAKTALAEQSGTYVFIEKKLKAKLGYDPIQNKVGEGYKIPGRSLTDEKNVAAVETRALLHCVLLLYVAA